MSRWHPSHLLSLSNWRERTPANGVLNRMGRVYLLQLLMWCVEEEMEVTSVELDSSVSQAQGQAQRLCGRPRPPEPVSPPGPAVGGGKIRAYHHPLH